ncbi:30S ribosomal protein S17 [Candidatus Peregrinibacteria bacterium]|nr:30S ribosomal protein S17 [Candidatus Peregrinibacteria bacterium]
MARSKKGIVVSNKMDKTIVIQVHTYKMHPKYKKRYRTSKKFYAHDPQNMFKIGDEVTIYETRPLSKLKRWTVEEPTVSANPVK